MITEAPITVREALRHDYAAMQSDGRRRGALFRGRDGERRGPGIVVNR